MYYFFKLFSVFFSPTVDLTKLRRFSLVHNIFRMFFRDGSKYKLTTFSSGTDRLSVHSWLFTKASVKMDNIHKISTMTFNGLPHRISC